MSPSQHVTLVPSGEHEVPLVDVSAARSDDPEAVAELARELGAVARDTGYFLLRDPEITPEALEAAKDSMLEFFALSHDQKMEIDIAKSGHHRGYFPIGEENALHSEHKDIKEGFDMALDVPEGDPAVGPGSLYGPNVWPERPADFRADLERIFDQFRASCATMAGLFALEWGLPRDFFVPRADKPLTQMRAVRYPSQEPTAYDGDEPIGCGTHTDYSVVTIIWQVDEPGLQVEAKDGSWVDAPVVPGTFACTLGDATGMWTNDEWRATPHRVINSSGRERHSIAFFFDPNAECEIAPLDAFVSDERPARYGPTTMGDHVRRGFDGTFSYRDDAPEEPAVA